MFQQMSVVNIASCAFWSCLVLFLSQSAISTVLNNRWIKVSFFFQSLCSPSAALSPGQTGFNPPSICGSGTEDEEEVGVLKTSCLN